MCLLQSGGLLEVYPHSCVHQSIGARFQPR
eukprot:COSAG01_NODE_62676_length_283_cov_1.119565_1_plen_29_part_10